MKYGSKIQCSLILTKKMFKILSLVLIWISTYYSQNYKVNLENLSIADGLPENSVTCILQDYLGYLWLGTHNGLVKYDGYTMENFQLEENNPSGITIKGIVTIYEDKHKTLWVGTLNGLYKYDRIDNSFKSYKHCDSDTNSINCDKVRCIYEDQKGNFWVGTKEGLNLFERSNEIFTRCHLKYSNGITDTIITKDSIVFSINAMTEDSIGGDILLGTNLPGLWILNYSKENATLFRFDSTQNTEEKIGEIQSFFKSKDGTIWMASYHTLTSCNIKTKEIKSYIDFPISVEERFIKNDFVNGSVIEDRFGYIWCGFFLGEKGVFRVNPKNASFIQIELFPNKTKSGYYNRVFSLYEDHSGIIWIGSWMCGLNKWDQGKNKFHPFDMEFKNLDILNHFSTSALTYDSSGFIWFSTDKGLLKYNFRNNEYSLVLKNETCITNYVVNALMKDGEGNLWMGTSSCGLIKYNPRNNLFDFHFNNPKDEHLHIKAVLYLLQDHLGDIWIGTYADGIYRYNISKNKLTQFRYDPNNSSGLKDNQVNVIYEDHLGALWVGTGLGGLNKFDRKKDKFIYCGFNSVMAIHEDRLNNFWVADYSLGLNQYDRDKGEVTKCYTLADGLPSISIRGILEDTNNNLWLSTDNGLSRFNIKSKSFNNYKIEDGLIDNIFSLFCYCKGPNGILIFNTNSGLVAFNPEKIINDPIPPKTIIEQISLFNKPNEKLKINGFISELKELVLSYDQNDLRFDFVGIHFSEPKKNKYKYILGNFDDKWVEAGYQRNATYTNLEPGEYVFKVIAANRDGIWNTQAASIKIIILHPWWATTWAYFIYAIIILGSLYILWKLQFRRIRIKQELAMSKFETDKLQEVDKLKTKFFTNISHEFRTPLTLIQAPAKVIIDKSKDLDIKDNANLIYRNAIKLNGLVNQLLDLAKLEAGEMTLKVNETDLIALLKDIIISFTPFAERKKIKFTFNSKEDELYVYLDKDKIQKIIYNILSNAFKFTAEGGEINVNVLKGNNDVMIKISDTGIGIPSNRIDKIFDRFYQVDDTHTREHEGTGIGLALTKELVDLHKGKIEVESKEGEGSTFTFTLSLSKENYNSDQIINSSKDVENISVGEKDYLLEPQTTSNQIDSDLLSEEDKPLLLVVDDNDDVRDFIKGILDGDNKILEARNGLEGLKISFNEIPDLIICDLMMPKLDGFEMSAKLKNDERTSHIPIIMLTAKATNKNKIEGYETGADDYIIKPFDAEVLRTRAKNLIEQRKKLREYFTTNGLFYLDKSKISNIDKSFLQKVVDIINKHISDSLFGVELLSEELTMSRATLNKKLVALIGEPPGEFIKRIRLTKAAKLLQNNHENISQIALEVGFNNPAYFSECFRKQFGVSPSQYLQKFNNH